MIRHQLSFIANPIDDNNNIVIEKSSGDDLVGLVYRTSSGDYSPFTFGENIMATHLPWTEGQGTAVFYLQIAWNGGDSKLPYYPIFTANYISSTDGVKVVQVTTLTPNSDESMVYLSTTQFSERVTGEIEFFTDIENTETTITIDHTDTTTPTIQS